METLNLKEKNTCVDKKLLKRLKICLYISGIVITSLNLIVPYFAREMQDFCDSGCISLVLTIFAVFRLLGSLITGLYICELGARNSIIKNLILNTVSLIGISIVPRIVKYLVLTNNEISCFLFQKFF